MVALRPTVSASRRAIVRYDGSNMSYHRQNPLIHSIRASRPYPTHNSSSITSPQSSNRYLSHSIPSASQAAAARAPEPERNQDEERTQKRPQLQRKHGSEEVLSGVNSLLDNIGLPPSRQQNGASRRRDMDRSVGSDVQDIFAQRSSMLTGKRAARNNLRDIAGLPTFSGKVADETPLSPTLGRSIAVRQGDVRSALSMLGVRLAQNKVRADARNQKTHIRRGMKKKQLRRERWRKMFKESFDATVSRCSKLAKQGW